MKKALKTAMILAAGRGERLKPFTDRTPKPLMNVNGKPLIEYHIENLVKANFERIVIYHAHLGGQIRQFIGDGKRYGIDIVYSPEPPGGLETGGGLYEASEVLGKEPFLSVNADIITDFDFAKRFDFDDALATIVLVPTKSYHTKGDFYLTEDNFVKNTPNQYIYSGIAIYHPDIFNFCSFGRYSIAPLIRQMSDENRIRGILHEGIFDDLGTYEQFKKYE